MFWAVKETSPQALEEIREIRDERRADDETEDPKRKVLLLSVVPP